MKRVARRLLFLIGSLVFLSFAARTSNAAESPPLRKLRVAITSLSGSMAVPWLAREAGIFKKHGLEVEVIATPSGVEGMSALIAGEVTFLQIAGATTVSAAVGGADVIVIGTTIGTLVLNLVVRPEIEKAEQRAASRSASAASARRSTPERVSRYDTSASCRKKMFRLFKSAAWNRSCRRWPGVGSKAAFFPTPQSDTRKNSAFGTSSTSPQSQSKGAGSEAFLRRPLRARAAKQRLY